MITFFITNEIDLFKRAAFEQYARHWDEAIPRCGADLVGDLSPYEDSATIGTAFIIFPRSPPMSSTKNALRKIRLAERITNSQSANSSFAGKIECFRHRPPRLMAIS